MTTFRSKPRSLWVVALLAILLLTLGLGSFGLLEDKTDASFISPGRCSKLTLAYLRSPILAYQRIQKLSLIRPFCRLSFS